MRSLVLLILTFNIFAQDNFAIYKKPLLSIESTNSKVVSSLLDIEKEVQLIKDYKHPNFLTTDQLRKDQIVKEIEIIQKKLKSSHYFLKTKDIKSNIEQLYKAQEKKNKFLAKEQKLKEIENGMRTKKMDKYIHFLQQGKYLRADATKALMNNYEKIKANKYKELRSYVIRESGIQQKTEKDIIKIKQSIAQKLERPLLEVSVVQKQLKKLQVQLEKFDNLKSQLNQQQYQFYANYFKSGFFSCDKESKPRVVRFKHNKNLVGLAQGNKIVSYFNIKQPLISQSENVNIPSYIYRCKTAGMLGGCIENTEKEICKTDPICNTKFELMEKSFHKHFSFNKQFSKLLTFYKKEEDRQIMANKKLDILNEFEKKNKLGNITRKELQHMQNSLYQYAMTVSSQDKNSFLKNVSNKMKQLKKEQLNKKNYNQRANLSIDYAFNNALSTLKSLQKEDFQQKYFSTECEVDDYCHKYKNYLDEKKKFNDYQEITNLTQDKCPQVTIRLKQYTSNEIEKASCSKENLNTSFRDVKDLYRDTKEIVNQMNSY
ncbi:MAG: hypothetical protein N4A33_12125 [Bacteriovoracaceae bacterium]|jgi:hypothetical protein|nr:hypothetical protein [Bacteriovoracaceae bacterium]